jgi:predicted HicB family RNase H-like nuclease
MNIYLATASPDSSPHDYWESCKSITIEPYGYEKKEYYKTDCELINVIENCSKDTLILDEPRRYITDSFNIDIDKSITVYDGRVE